MPTDDKTFLYAACPVGPDGRKRAVTRDGREVILLCDDAPGTQRPIIGWVAGSNEIMRWSDLGERSISRNFDLFVPPLPKRVVWVNLCETCTLRYNTLEEADEHAARYTGRRLGNRAYRIEIDP